MKVYLSVDMEGIAGVGHPNPTNRGDPGYPAAVELMTAEANAAIAGCRAAGATEILVNDSHGGMYNLDPRTMDPAAERIGDRAVRHRGDDPVAAYRGLLAGVRLAGTVD